MCVSSHMWYRKDQQEPLGGEMSFTPCQWYSLCIIRGTEPVNHLVVLVVKASTSGAEGPEFESCLRQDFPGRVIPVTSKLALQWLPCQVSGVLG